MSYLIFVTFDLKNATSQNYKEAYADLEKSGLRKIVAGTTGSAVIPTTSVMGQFSGDSAVSARDSILQKVVQTFKARGFRAEIFVTVGGDWAWGASST